MSRPVRALGIIRKSVKAGERDISFPVQRAEIERFTQSNSMALIGIAEDKAVSAFKIPPDRRKQVKEWLDKPNEFDCIVYYRQDRLVRQPMDFMGIVHWCQQNGKSLYSATEGTGDVTQDTGVLIGFVKAWQSWQESKSSSQRQKSNRKEFARQGRWPGGRPAYGLKPVESPDGAGYVLVPDEGKTAEAVREASRRVLAGESVNAICSDFNKRRILSADGKAWHPTVMRKILSNRALLNGVLSASEWSELQEALKATSGRNNQRRSDTDNILLDLIFCAKCGNKMYKWRRPRDGKYYARCRNEMKRAQVLEPCNASMVPYDEIKAEVARGILVRSDYMIEERVPRDGSAIRQLRIDDIAQELLDLATRFTAKSISRNEYITQQTALLDEQAELESAADDTDVPEWKPTGETVGERWNRLSPSERRLWLLKVGARFTVGWVTVNGERRISVMPVIESARQPGESTAAYRLRSHAEYEQRVMRPIG
jgi:site-specific DNA recombinase